MNRANRSVFASSLVLLTLALIGCQQSRDDTHTVSYFREHADEREAMLRRCADDPGTFDREPNCINAKQAAMLEGIGSVKDLPPMGLTPEKNRATQPDDPKVQVRPAR